MKHLKWEWAALGSCECGFLLVLQMVMGLQLSASWVGVRQPWEPEPLKHTLDVTGSLGRGRIRVLQEKPRPCWCCPCCAAQGEAGSVLSPRSVHCHGTFQVWNVVEWSVNPGRTHVPVWQIERAGE